MWRHFNKKRQNKAVYGLSTVFQSYRADGDDISCRLLKELEDFRKKERELGTYKNIRGLKTNGLIFSKRSHQFKNRQVQFVWLVCRFTWQSLA